MIYSHDVGDPYLNGKWIINYKWTKQSNMLVFCSVTLSNIENVDCSWVDQSSVMIKLMFLSSCVFKYSVFLKVISTKKLFSTTQ